LGALGCQAWMTGTDAETFGGLGAMGAVFQVDAGTVLEVAGSE
jgi:hypothetical protein